MITRHSGTDGPFRTPIFLRRRAAEESADPELLTQLACDESYWVRRQAAQNPALPRSALETLVRAGAKRDLRGFAKPDDTLERGPIDSIARLGGFGRLLAVRHANTSGDTLAMLARDEVVSIRLEVAQHANTSAASIERLCSDLEVDVRITATRHVRADESVIARLRSAGASLDLRFVEWPDEEPGPEQLAEVWACGPWGRLLAARRPACPRSLQRLATQDSDWRIRAAVLENATLPDADLEPYVIDGEIDLETLRALGLRRPNSKAFDYLTRHPDPEVRLALAQHPLVDPSNLATLTSDTHRGVRGLVARNPRTPTEEIQRLTRAGATPDLETMSTKPETPSVQDLEELSRRGPWARMLVARHASSPPRLLAALLCDGSPTIRQWALVHPHAPARIVRELVRCGSGDDLQGFHEADPEVPMETLRELSERGPWARRLVALHPATPLDLIARLARSEEWKVRRNIAMRRNLPADLLRSLARDPVEEVRIAAGEPSTTRDNPFPPQSSSARIRNGT